MNPASNICYIVGAMSLTPDLRPYPVAGDYVIAADRGFDSLMASIRTWRWATSTLWATGPATPM